MKRAYTQSEDTPLDWREALVVCFDQGLPSAFCIEWLIDRAERGDWSGLSW